MAQFVSAGGNNKNGKVSTLGADDLPVVELTATDTDSLVEAGQTGRPARLSLYDATHSETIRATAADGKLIAGGNGVNGQSRHEARTICRSPSSSHRTRPPSSALARPVARPASRCTTRMRRRPSA